MALSSQRRLEDATRQVATLQASPQNIEFENELTVVLVLTTFIICHCQVEDGKRRHVELCVAGCLLRSSLTWFESDPQPAPSISNLWCFCLTGPQLRTYYSSAAQRWDVGTNHDCVDAGILGEGCR
jgi:hypothetical protein